MDKLEGLELRKAALTAVGWKLYCVEYGEINLREAYTLVSPEKRFYPTPNIFHPTEADAWQHAPAVESSVDAALQWLTLGDTCGWQIHWPMADTDSPAGQVTIMNYQNRRTYSALFRTNAAAAMCDAYLQYKAGA